MKRELCPRRCCHANTTTQCNTPRQTVLGYRGALVGGAWMSWWMWGVLAATASVIRVPGFAAAQLAFLPNLLFATLARFLRHLLQALLCSPFPLFVLLALASRLGVLGLGESLAALAVAGIAPPAVHGRADGLRGRLVLDADISDPGGVTVMVAVDTINLSVRDFVNVVNSTIKQVCTCARFVHQCEQHGQTGKWANSPHVIRMPS